MGELAATVGIEQSAVSHQLRLLRRLGLVIGERQGRQIIHGLHDSHVGVLLAEAIYHVEHVRLGLPMKEPVGAGLMSKDAQPRAWQAQPRRPPSHSHGLVNRSIVRSREGVKAVSTSIVVLGIAAGVQLFIFLLSGSVALLAYLLHNFGDALTAVPLGIAFFLLSVRGEKLAGLALFSRSSSRPVSPSTRRSGASFTPSI